jgi:hypothetical protein
VEQIGNCIATKKFEKVKVASEIGEKRKVFFYKIAVTGGLFMSKKLDFQV